MRQIPYVLIVFLAGSIAATDWIAAQVQPTHASGADAAARVEALLEAMGGRRAWASAAAVQVDATHHTTETRRPFRNQIWNDFSAPRLRIEASSEDLDRSVTVDGGSGTRRDRAAVQPLTPAQLADQRRWWESNVYRTLHRLARRDPGIEARLLTPARLGIFRTDGVRLNWMELNQLSEPVLFGTWDSETGSVFGPLAESRSGLKHPKWVTSADGTWRVELRSMIPIAAADVLAPPSL